MDAGLERQEVAGRIGVRAATLAAWEKGLNEPAWRRWPAVLAFLGHDPHGEPRTLPEQLAHVQRLRGWSNRDLAGALGVGLTALARWKLGHQLWASRPQAAVVALLQDHGLEFAMEWREQSVSGHLVKRRAALALDHGAAARRIGVCRGTYRGWERGRHPSARFWPAIIDFLGHDPHPSPVTLGGRLAAARRVLGLSQQDLARRLGVTQGAVHRWEAGLKVSQPRCQAAVQAFLSKVPWPRFSDTTQQAGPRDAGLAGG